MLLHIAACKELPAHTPDASPLGPGICGNGIAEPNAGELCDGREFADSRHANLQCGSPGTPQECQIACQGGCPPGFACGELTRCEYVRELRSSWSGPMSSTGRDIAVGRVDGDMYPDLIAIDATQITLRLGDGAGGFGPASTTALRDGRAGPASIVDLDNNGLLDVLVVLGANADTFDIALANTSGGWNTSTISLAAGERALGIIGVNALRLTSTPRDIVVLVESPAGRLLRLYASHLVGGYSATDSFDSTDPALADIVVPVIWAATTTVAGREVLGASVTGPGPLWIELSGSQVVHVGTNRPTVAPPWLRAVEGAPVYKYDASNVQSAAFAVTTDAGFGIAFRTDTADITSEPIDSNTAWFDAVGGTPLVIAAHGTQLETGGAWYRPPIAQLPFAPTTLRVADLNVDGFPDLVIANNAAAAALLAAGHLE